MKEELTNELKKYSYNELMEAYRAIREAFKEAVAEAIAREE